MAGEKETILEVKDLSVKFSSSRGDIYAVNDISYSVGEGEILGIVGESGCGKSTSAYAITGLLPPNGSIVGGDILYKGESIPGMDARQLRKMRGEEIGMIFQNPMQCLDPVFTIGSQMLEMIGAHREMDKTEAYEMSIRMLRSAGIKDPEKMMKSFQHELSGGMCQRVMIAMAMLLQPKLLIADEPTTALDVTIQDRILGLIKDETARSDMAVIFITHNLGVVADICDRVCVMYGGRIAESGTVNEIFYEHRHPYTKGLLDSVPKADVFDKRHLSSIEGSPIDMAYALKGCPFAPRCAEATQQCSIRVPRSVKLSDTHTVACWDAAEKA